MSALGYDALVSIVAHAIADAQGDAYAEYASEFNGYAKAAVDALKANYQADDERLRQSLSALEEAGVNWNRAFAKAFITQVSESDEYYIKLKFKTMAEMHAAYDAMAKLAALTYPEEGAK